jgi:hypothetical protein
MDESYAEVGTEVILGKHVHKFGGQNWIEAKEAYVGMRTTITRVRGLRDFAGCLCCSVVCDGGEYSWRVESMILASDVPLLTPQQRVQLRIRE